MKHLYYCRHGESEAQTAKIWSGQNDPPLNDTGREQARKAARDILNEHLRFDLIVASPLARASETATIIADIIGYPLEKIAYNPLFKERTFGVLDGKPVGNFFDSHEYKDVDDVEGAETIENLQSRAKTALAYLQTLPQDTILVVGHGAFGRALRRVVENRPYTDEFMPLNMKKLIPNAEPIKLI